MKFAIAVAAATSTLAAGAATAGGYTPPVVDETPVVVTQPAPVVAGGWTGFYAGLQYGQGNAELFDGTASVDSDFDAYGLHVGYNHNFGQFVLGGELDYNRIKLDETDDKGDLTRLRARAGYDMGRFMPYVTLGAARVSADVGGLDIKETGMTYGLGGDFKVTDKITVGAEYTRQKWDDVADVSGADLDADLFQVRASWRF